MALIPHFAQHELDSSDIGLALRLSAFNWCNSFDAILPFADGKISASDRAHLWGMYSGIEILGRTQGSMLAAKHVRRKMHRRSRR